MPGGRHSKCEGPEVGESIVSVGIAGRLGGWREGVQECVLEMEGKNEAGWGGGRKGGRRGREEREGGHPGSLEGPDKGVLLSHWDQWLNSSWDSMRPQAPQGGLIGFLFLRT